MILNPITLLQFTASAMEDYNTARGRAHLKMLTEARPRLYARMKKLHEARQQLLHKGEEFEKAVQKKIWYDLNLQITRNTLETSPIPGVDCDRLIKVYFKGNLEDLLEIPNGSKIYRECHVRISSLVKQSQLDRSSLTEKYPELLEKSLSVFESSRVSFTGKINDLNHEIALVQSSLLRCDLAIERLNQVRWTDYFRVAVGSRPPESVHYFTMGLFAEWEDVPDWFKTILHLAQ